MWRRYDRKGNGSVAGVGYWKEWTRQKQSRTERLPDYEAGKKIKRVRDLKRT